MAAVCLMALPGVARADESKTTPLIMIVVGFDGGGASAGDGAIEVTIGGDEFDDADEADEPDELDEIDDDGELDAFEDDADDVDDGEDEEFVDDADDDDESVETTRENGGASKAVPYDSELDWGQTIFGSNDSLSSYYLDMSGGSFTFVPASETCAYDGKTVLNKSDKVDDGIVHITLHRAHGAWGTVNESEDVAQDFGLVVLEAFVAASEYVDFAQYDTNGDALLTPDELSVGVCIAGYDAAPFEHYDRTDIPVLWPHQGILTKAIGEEGTADGMYLASYIAIAEYLTYDQEKPVDIRQEPLGVLYHELGHYLGLIDLYPRNEDPEKAAWGAYRIGELSLMDHGGWSLVYDSTGTNYTNTPSAFDPWSRYVLGWSMPHVVTKSGDYTVTSQLSDAGYTQLLIPTADPDQYYLIENRQVEGHDAGLAAALDGGNQRGGIVIWHIDKGIYRDYGADNRANDSDHAPAIMAQFFEEVDGHYTSGDSAGTPVLNQPFFDSEACKANLGDAKTSVELPLYATPKTDGPNQRTSSGITLQFPDSSAREMTVHVELPTDVAAVAHKAYPLDETSAQDLRMGKGPLATLACAALIRETGADVSAVDAGSIKGGLPSTNVTWADAYGVLPSDCNIVLYELTGEQLVELAGRSLRATYAYQAASAAIEAIRGFCGVEKPSGANSQALGTDAALAFGNMSFDVEGAKGSKADAASGAANVSGNAATAGGGAVSKIRATNVTVGGVPVELDNTYRVAMTPGVADRYDFFDGLNADIILLWGTPADAVRSYVQQKNWEDSLL